MFLSSRYYSNELQTHQIAKISHKLTHLEVALLVHRLDLWGHFIADL